MIYKHVTNRSLPKNGDYRKINDYARSGEIPEDLQDHLVCPHEEQKFSGSSGRAAV